MTWVDALVVLVLMCSALIGFLRGLVREALGICAWVGAFYVALSMFSSAQPEVRKLVQNPEIADPIAFFLVFLFALVGFSIVAGLFGRVVRRSALGGLDRSIGFLFGALRGAFLLSAAYIGAGLLIAVGMWPEAVLEARSLPYVYQGAQWVASEWNAASLTGDWKRLEVDPPPPAVAAHSNDLLQSPPRGFALDGRAPPQSVDNPPGNAGQEGN